MTIAIISTWLGPELQDRPADWIHRLAADEVADLERALAHARATAKPIAVLAREDFPLPVLEPAIRDWLRTLQHGRGFLNVKGVPVERHSDEDAALFQWGLGLHLGAAVSQNAAGDLLGHVRDTGADPNDTSVRLYKTRVELIFHSDGSDLVALLCIRPGRIGGENRLRPNPPYCRRPRHVRARSRNAPSSDGWSRRRVARRASLSSTT